MVVFEVTSQLTFVLEKAGLAEHCRSLPSGQRFIHHKLIIDALQQLGPGSTSFASLVRESKLYRNYSDALAECAGPPARNPELEKRLAVLRSRNEEKLYANMVRNVAGRTSTGAQEEAARLGQFGAQMSLGVNVIVTMATCFVAGYFVFKHSSGRESIGLVGGVVCMIVAMAVETTLVIIRMHSIEAAASKDREKKARQVPCDHAQTVNHPTRGRV